MDKLYKIHKGSRTIGPVVAGLGYNINEIIMSSAPIPDDAAEPQYNDMEEIEEVGTVCSDQFDMLSKLGSQAYAYQSGMAGSQSAQVRE